MSIGKALVGLAMIAGAGIGTFFGGEIFKSARNDKTNGDDTPDNNEGNDNNEGDGTPGDAGDNSGEG